MIAIYTTTSGTAEHLYNNQQHVLTVHVSVSQLWDNYKNLQVISRLQCWTSKKDVSVKSRGEPKSKREAELSESHWQL